MQTFLPYSDFAQTAKVLDRQRLGKQRVETLQILTALVRPDYGWQSHPAVKMWRGYEWALYEYQKAICSEWTSRGYKDTCLAKSFLVLEESGILSPIQMPPWLGDANLHRSHRSNLLRKNADHYSAVFEPGLADDIPYVWPEPQQCLTQNS